MTLLLLLMACVHEAADSADPGAPVDAWEPVACPPTGPGGLEVGEVATDLAFTTCDGVAGSLHGLCGAPALVINWYGWCPSCEGNAALARQLADEHSDLSVVVVLDQDPLGLPVDAEFCTAYEADRPSSAIVWMDPAAALELYGTTDLVLVLDREGVLRLVRETSSEDAIRAAVEQVVE